MPQKVTIIENEQITRENNTMAHNPTNGLAPQLRSFGKRLNTGPSIRVWAGCREAPKMVQNPGVANSKAPFLPRPEEVQGTSY